MTVGLFGAALQGTLAWPQKCRGILVRYDKTESCPGLVRFMRALRWFGRLFALAKTRM